MRVGINALFQASGGSLTNLVQLINEWNRAGVFDAHELVFFLNDTTRARLQGTLPATAKQVRLAGADKGLAARLIVEQLILPREIRRQALDVLFCPGNTVPFLNRVPCVVTFQNAAPFTPSISIRSVGWSRWLRFQLLGLCMRMGSRSADRVIFGSEHFRNLFLSQVRLERDKTAVIYRTFSSPAAPLLADRELEAKRGIRRPYILSVSHLQPYKNLVELVEGFDLARRRGALDGVQLVLAGGVYLSPDYARRVEAKVHELGLSRHQLLLAGDIPHREIGPLLAGADAFVFTSTCENCPTGLVEAMSMGLPIACSQLSSMPEVAGEAALYFDPYVPADIAAVLRQLFTSPELKRTLSERAIARARKWPDPTVVARQTWRVIETAGQESAPRTLLQAAARRGIQHADKMPLEPESTFARSTPHKSTTGRDTPTVLARP